MGKNLAQIYGAVLLRAVGGVVASLSTVCVPGDLDPIRPPVIAVKAIDGNEK